MVCTIALESINWTPPHSRLLPRRVRHQFYHRVAIFGANTFAMDVPAAIYKLSSARPHAINAHGIREYPRIEHLFDWNMRCIVDVQRNKARGIPRDQSRVYAKRASASQGRFK